MPFALKAILVVVGYLVIAVICIALGAASFTP